MSDFLVKLLSSLGASLLNGILDWWKQKELEAKAEQAKELEKLLQAIKENEAREATLREVAKQHVEWSYAEWEASP